MTKVSELKKYLGLFNKEFAVLDLHPGCIAITDGVVRSVYPCDITDGETVSYPLYTFLEVIKTIKPHSDLVIDLSTVTLQWEVDGLSLSTPLSIRPTDSGNPDLTTLEAYTSFADNESVIRSAYRALKKVRSLTESTLHVESDRAWFHVGSGFYILDLPDDLGASFDLGSDFLKLMSSPLLKGSWYLTEDNQIAATSDSGFMIAFNTKSNALGQLPSSVVSVLDTPEESIPYMVVPRSVLEALTDSFTTDNNVTLSGNSMSCMGKVISFPTNSFTHSVQLNPQRVSLALLADNSESWYIRPVGNKVELSTPTLQAVI